MRRQIAKPCDLVVPVSLYDIPSQLHSVLRSYKARHVPPALPRQVAALLAYFLRHHGDCIERAAGSSWDVITTVPSSSGRAGKHPLAAAVELVPKLATTYQPLLARGPGSLGHNTASDDGFIATTAVADRRILVVDDTYTSGARAQSAASALQLAGASVIAIVPVGRVIDPQFKGATSQAYWKTQTGTPFDWDDCCIH